MDSKKLSGFQNEVWKFYRENGRHDLPWRQPEVNGVFDPYKILVSEIMLQQTQVARVIPKFLEFLAHYPDLKSLAESSLGDVLKVWNGLGYNRRAKYLWQAAQKIESDFDGTIPREAKQLESLPGVGANTAGAILTYAFNEHTIFIETNIRTVYIHHFFGGHTDITDSEIRLLVEKTIDKQKPREWYWALMDYGSYLKQTVGNLNRASKTYGTQSKFEGSRRQIRGQIIHALIEKPASESKLKKLIDDSRLVGVLEELVKEDLIQRTGAGYALLS